MSKTKGSKKIRQFEQAKIVSVFNQKGGCGKTMLTMQLGGCLALRGYRVMVIDMDTQGTSVMWSGQAEKTSPFPATVVSLSAMQENMIGEVEKLSKNYDFIFIDCPPAIESPIPWAALNISDIGLMPIVPVADNYWASSTAKELGMRAMKENPELTIYYVPSMIRRGRLLDAFLNQIKEDPDIEVLGTGLGLRNAFAESQIFGATVHALGKSITATQELEAFADEFLSVLK